MRSRPIWHPLSSQKGPNELAQRLRALWSAIYKQPTPSNSFKWPKSKKKTINFFLIKFCYQREWFDLKLRLSFLVRKKREVFWMNFTRLRKWWKRAAFRTLEGSPWRRTTSWRPTKKWNRNNCSRTTTGSTRASSTRKASHLRAANKQKLAKWRSIGDHEPSL